jgi:glycosyltransferase involved in cell wall biosynthesis
MAEPELLTIIIPAFNEERRLPECLAEVTAFVQDQHDAMRILVVENGSTDRTAQIAEEFAARHSCVSILRSAKGKGNAVRAGMLAGQGRYLLACDCDLSVPIECVRAMLPPALPDCDVAIGSREAPGAKRYHEPLFRHAMGRIFNAAVRLLAVRGLQDTQCGFKCFRREVARDVFALQRVTGWAYDVEVLLIAQRHGYRIAEVPVQWTYSGDSRISLTGDTWRMFRDVLHVRRNARRGLYDRRP